MDNLCVMNDGNEFLTSLKNIYPKELEPKIELQGNHASFLDDKIEDSIFVHKFFLSSTSILHSANTPYIKQYNIDNILRVYVFITFWHSKMRSKN